MRINQSANDGGWWWTLCAFLVVAGKPHANFYRVVDQVFDELEKGT